MLPHFLYLEHTGQQAIERSKAFGLVEAGCVADPRDGHQLLSKEIWCRPCHRHECARLDCLDWISVAEAKRAVERALAHGERRRAIV